MLGGLPLALASAYGTFPEWIGLAAVAGAAWFFARGGGRTALATLETANRVLETEIQSLQSKLTHAEASIAELQAQKDVAIAITPLVAWTAEHEKLDADRHVEALLAFNRVAEHLAGHEERADVRTERLLKVLDMIAARIGPEPS